MHFWGDYLYVLGCTLLLLACFVPVFINNKNLLNKTANFLAVCASLTFILASIKVFVFGDIVFSFIGWQPFGNIIIKIDFLSAFFLMLLGIVGTAASFFAIGYCKEFYNKRLKQLIIFYNIFLLAMVGVISLQNIILFLFFWELMALSSFFLVNHLHEKAENNKAGYVYLGTTHIGTIFIVIAFFLLLPFNSEVINFSFAALKAENVIIANIVFFLALIGFGSKAGIAPLHFWLPMAHPVAPSHVSALMSALMLKVSLYGFCRFVLFFLADMHLSYWCGGVVLILASLSCLRGIMGALKAIDFKKILAYSSIENIGLIFLSLGMALFFESAGRPWLAALAWSAAFYHIFNHAIYKALLFLGAGFIIQKIKEKNIEKMGGLIKFLPYVSFFVLIGIMSVIALPPLNGFFSEWLIFKSIASLHFSVMGIEGKLLSAMILVVFALTVSLSVLAFVRLYAIVFLARVRDLKVKELLQKTVKEKQCESKIMLFPLLFLSFICLCFGAWNTPIMLIIGKILGNVGNNIDTNMISDVDSILFSVNINEQSWGGMLILSIMMLIAVLITILIYYLRGKSKKVYNDIWACGIKSDASMEYTARALSMPITRVFSTVQLDHYLEYCKLIFSKYTKRLILAMRTIQDGSGQFYIAYILLATIAVLFWSTRWW